MPLAHYPLRRKVQLIERLRFTFKDVQTRVPKLKVAQLGLPLQFKTEVIRQGH